MGLWLPRDVKAGIKLEVVGVTCIKRMFMDNFQKELLCSAEYSIDVYVKSPKWKKNLEKGIDTGSLTSSQNIFVS